MDAQSERRVITALFIDVVGSTDLMMRVGPEVIWRQPELPPRAGDPRPSVSLVTASVRVVMWQLRHL